MKLDHALVLAVIAAVALVLIIPPGDIMDGSKKGNIVRKAAVSGAFYPASAGQLRDTVDSLIDEASPTKGDVKAIIVPHAGYIYSGIVAASSFSSIKDDYENIFILAPSHYYPLEGMSIADVTHYETPLGLIPLSKKAADMRKETGSIPKAHQKEHSIEVELPFIQVTQKDPKIVPILVGREDTEDVKNLIIRHLGENDLLIVSVDLSHFHNYSDAKKLDSYSIDSILKLDSEAIMDAEIDAPWAVSALIKIAKEKGWEPKLLSYRNSGDVTGDKKSVVGYAAVAFLSSGDYEGNKEENAVYSEKERELMLSLARDKISSLFTDEKIDISNIPKSLKEERACFVTLTIDGELRGCIGHLKATMPLYECILENAENAAMHDTRFDQLSKEELDEIKIEISVLSEPLPSTVDDIIPEKHGVILKKGLRSATFLPQVWEQLPEKEDFLRHLALKAGLSSYEGASFQVYTVESFEEE